MKGNYFLKRGTFLFLFLYLVCFSFVFSQESSKVEIAILHTNDHHGRYEAFDMVGQKQTGGMPARMTLIKEVKQDMQKRGGSVLLFDCGDINTGEPGSDIIMAEPDVRCMNLMGYNAMALGNHEFDLTMENLLKQEKMANFPFLSANIFWRKDGKPVFKPLMVIVVQGLRIGVFGITTPNTPWISTKGKNDEIVFANPRDVIPQVLKQFENQVDFTIALMHVDQEEVMDLAKRFPGIDMILSGHTHLPIPKPITVGKTLIAEAGSYGMMVGKWNLVWEGRKLAKWDYELVGLNLSEAILDEKGRLACAPYHKKFQADPEIVEFLKPYEEQTAKLLGDYIGNANDDFPKTYRSARPKSSALGNLISDAMRDACKADVVLQNIGGIRSDLLKGCILSRDIHRILPFANTIVVYSLTGKQLLAVLMEMAKRDPSNGGHFEVSGLSLRVKDGIPMNININGKPLELEMPYKVATNSFIAGGGDGYSIFQTFPNKEDRGVYIAPVLIEYIKRNTPITPNHELRIDWEN